MTNLHNYFFFYFLSPLPKAQGDGGKKPRLFIKSPSTFHDFASTLHRLSFKSSSVPHGLSVNSPSIFHRLSISINSLSTFHQAPWTLHRLSIDSSFPSPFPFSFPHPHPHPHPRQPINMRNQSASIRAVSTHPSIHHTYSNRIVELVRHRDIAIAIENRPII